MIQSRYQSIVIKFSNFNFNDIRIRKIWISIRIILSYKNLIDYTYLRISNPFFNSDLRIVEMKKKETVKKHNIKHSCQNRASHLSSSKMNLQVFDKKQRVISNLVMHK